MRAYNRAHRNDPVDAQEVTKGIRQTTAVITAFTGSVMAVLDALALLNRATAVYTPTGAGGGGSRGFGQRVKDFEG